MTEAMGLSIGPHNSQDTTHFSAFQEQNTL